jgi:CheY-like chemotaxis protein/HPt (histidine-containing phosphotransfer) domain-containing protein
VQAGYHLTGLVDDVIDLSRVESGTLHLSSEPVDLTDVLRQSLALVRPLSARSAVELPTQAPGDGLHVLGDRQRLVQVFANLLSNAVKYNRPGGSVHVTVERRGDRVAVAVTDTGRGVRDEDLERLFVPFERLGIDDGIVPGTGLGLALSKHLTETMGGIITARSTVGEGSTFTVDLRMAAAWDLPDEGPVYRPATAPASGGLLLYIEDNDPNVRLMERVVALRPGVEMLSATDGGSGIELARNNLPDLVLLDLHLPDMTGVDVLHQLKSDPLTADLTVVVLSADATPGQPERLAHAGAAGYMTKPYGLDEILHLLDTALPGGAAHGSPAAIASITHTKPGATRTSLPRRGLIDPSRAEMLRTLGDTERLTSLVTGFGDRARMQASEMRESAIAGDMARVSELAHDLKGAGALVGAEDVSVTAELIEADAVAGRAERLGPAFDRLEQEIDAALEALSELFCQPDNRG